MQLLFFIKEFFFILIVDYERKVYLDKMQKLVDCGQRFLKECIYYIFCIYGLGKLIDNKEERM